MYRLFLFLFVLFFSIFQTSCNEDEKIVNSNTIVKSKIEHVISSCWDAVLTKQDTSSRGYAIYVNSPKGFFYTSLGQLKNSTYLTKYLTNKNNNSFIASSVLLLYQQKKLNLDSYITSLIPNSTEPYIPESAEYGIPYKNNITIRQLLQHRAGILIFFRELFQIQ